MDLQAKRILVIDDDETFRTTVVAMLQRQGFDAKDASSGEQALALVPVEKPELILSDINMGGISGFEVLRTLRSSAATSAIPVIMMTGGPGADITQRSGMESGADDYLRKPFTMEVLMAAVRARFERQKSFHAQTRATEARLLEILSATQDLVAIAEAQTGELLYLNNAGRRMLGIGTQEDVSELCLHDFCAAGKEAAHALSSPTSKDGEAGIWVGESEFLSVDGRRIPVSKQILSHPSRPGESNYISVVARDMTERLAAEQERKMMEVQLRQAQKLEAIGQLASGIAHEINTPIQYVADNTRFLQESFRSIQSILECHHALKTAAREAGFASELVAKSENIIDAAEWEYLRLQIPSAVAETLEGIERITKIVRAMKEFSHPGGRGKASADLNRAIESTVTVARNEWKYVAGVKLELDPELPSVPCFLGEFNQAMLNLILNAAQAIGEASAKRSGEKGLITIRTRRDAEHVEIQVADSGPGIPVAIRGRVFEPFFTTKGVGKGTGQGLPQVYASIVKKHGGEVWFDSEEGKGTTFFVRLPLPDGSSTELVNHEKPSIR